MKQLVDLISWILHAALSQLLMNFMDYVYSSIHIFKRRPRDSNDVCSFNQERSGIRACVSRAALY